MIELVDVRLDHPRGGEPLVADASLLVARGEVVVIVGGAAAGTSRLVAAALGEVALAHGRIEVFGRDVARLRRSSLRLLRRRIGIVPQELCLLEDRSALINVALPLEIDGIPRSMSMERATECLAQMGLASDAEVPVEQLSASARQRVAVARALVRTPELILADQPTSAQDGEGTERVCEAFYEAASRGTSIMMFARDPALRAIATRNQWRQLSLVAGQLWPLGDGEGEARSMRHLLAGEPALTPPAPELQNVVPFPITARTAGTR